MVVNIAEYYTKLTNYKKRGVKVSLAIGGWNDSQGDKYSRLVNSRKARARFIKHVTKFLLKYNFDGLDLDWEYPACWQVGGETGDNLRRTLTLVFFRLSARLRDGRTRPGSPVWCRSCGQPSVRWACCCQPQCPPARRSLTRATRCPAWPGTWTGSP